jgi:polynucleotide 5'-hydroxyl-kinase GRC3/NOL9
MGSERRNDRDERGTGSLGGAVCGALPKGAGHCVCSRRCGPWQDYSVPVPGGSAPREGAHRVSGLRHRTVHHRTPRYRYLLPLLTGAKRLQERARERGAAFLIVDSPGYIEDRVAREFQIHLIDLLQPDHLVAIQKGGDLEEILAPFARHQVMQVHRLSPAPGVRARSQSERYRYREDLLQEYFAEAEDRAVPLSRIGIYGRVVPGLRREEWQGLLVAFCDAAQFVLALGVVQDIDPTGSMIRVRAPAFVERRVSALQVGSMKVMLSGSGENGG